MPAKRKRAYIDKTLTADFESGTIGDYFDSYDTSFYLTSSVAYGGTYSLASDDAGNQQQVHYATKAFDNKVNIKKIEFYARWNGTSQNDDHFFEIWDSSAVIMAILVRHEYNTSPARAVMLGGHNGLDTGVILPDNKWVRFTVDNITRDNDYDIEIYNVTDSVQLYSASSPYAFDFRDAEQYRFHVDNYTKTGIMYYDNVTIEYEELEWKRIKKPIRSIITNTYAYEEGDEHTTYTGGWETNTYTNYYTNYYAIVKNTDNLEMYPNNGDHSVAQTVNKIDMTNYRKMYIDYEIPSQTSGAVSARPQFRNNKNEHISDSSYAYQFDMTRPIGRNLQEYDISNITGSYYIYIGGDSQASQNITIKVYNIYFEELTWQHTKADRVRNEYYNADYESGLLSDYLDYSEVFYSITTDKPYTGSYSLKVNVTPQASDDYIAYKRISIPKTPDTIEFFAYGDFLTSANYDDFRVIFRNAETQKEVTRINVKEEYKYGGSALLNEFGDTPIDCGVTPLKKWLRFRWTNINYSAQTFDFEIYNITDTTSFYSNTGVSFANSEATTITEILFAASSYSGINYLWYVDDMTLSNDGATQEWNRIK